MPWGEEIRWIVSEPAELVWRATMALLMIPLYLIVRRQSYCTQAQVFPCSGLSQLPKLYKVRPSALSNVHDPANMDRAFDFRGRDLAQEVRNANLARPHFTTAVSNLRQLQISPTLGKSGPLALASSTVRT